MARKHNRGSRERLPARKHLRRLDRLYVSGGIPLFFLAVCVKDRRRVLATEPVGAVLRGAWANALDRHGWKVGRFVVMPDHVHFFAAPRGEGARDLSGFVRYWKRGTGISIRVAGLKSFA